MSRKHGRAVVAIYIDPDFYPPTINAILNLAEVYEEVIVISRNNTNGDYPFPSNVQLEKIGKKVTVREMEKQSMWVKAVCFLKFTFQLLHYSRSPKANLVVLYDPIALYGFYLVKKFIRRGKKKTWYHNHDMPLEGLSRQFSVGGLAAKYEVRAMESMDFFSLPARERIQCYPEIKDRVKIFVIPNYPSLKLYHSYKVKEKKEAVLRIIFQGFIGPGLCLENFIDLLPSSINKRPLHLILKGSVKDGYKKALNARAAQLNVSEKLTWVNIGPYSELLPLTSSCDIGIGININTDLISNMLNTASNKIYEYAASGLPVLLSDSEQYRQCLDKYEWAFFTDGSLNSLKESIILIEEKLPHSGNAARHDFEQSLNFEAVFLPVLQKVMAFNKTKN